jgi:class I fructose-bisphosphate aldolase
MMATVTKAGLDKIEEVLGDDARDLLEHKCQTVPKEQLHLPGPDFIDRVWKDSDRPTRVLRSLESLLDHGRLARTGYLSILPVDQGIEHTAGASFAPNPIYFDGAKIVELAIEGDCNAVAVHLQDQPQRAAHLPQPLRPDPVRDRQGSLGDGRRRRGSHDLLRLRAV